MSTATVSHQPTPARKSAQKASQAAAAPAPATPRDRAAQDAHETRLLATITGVASLIILVFFIAMMWWLSGYGPTA